MARKMALPKIGVNMTEAVIAKWLVSPGDVVKDGDAIMEAETDKSTQEIYATESGIVAELLADEGQTVECYSDIMVLIDEGEEYKEESVAVEKPEAKAAPPVAAAPVAAVVNTAPAPEVSGARVRVSPLAKKIAQENGIDFHRVPPATVGGRIVKKDVLAFIANGGAMAAEGENLDVFPMTSIRKTIAARMTA
ncbi:MAG: biotin/lipoyl-containing protein, partial [Christensenella sp.]